MRKVRDGINRFLQTLPQDRKDILIKQRILKVQSMWKDIAPEIIVEHTNSVFIKREEAGKRLIVYVDESFFAAELNALRELIKMQFKTRYQEDIVQFDILISKGSYKKNYPLREADTNKFTPADSRVKALPLTDEQKKWAFREVNEITNKKVKQALERAISSDLAWKNGVRAIGSHENQ